MPNKPGQKLKPVNLERNRRNLARLTRIMQRYNLNQSDIALLLNVSRMLVSRWFSDEKICPDHAPESVSAVCVCLTPAALRQEIMKRRNEAANK